MPQPLGPGLGRVQLDVEAALGCGVDEAMRAQPVLVQEGVVPEPPLPVGILQVVQLVDATVDVGIVVAAVDRVEHDAARSEEHTSELQSLMRISYAVFCLKKKNNNSNTS